MSFQSTFPMCFGIVNSLLKKKKYTIGGQRKFLELLIADPKKGIFLPFFDANMALLISYIVPNVGNSKACLHIVQ